MAVREFRVEDPVEALALEQALAMVRELRSAAAAAPDGQVLAVAEALAVRQGRELTRRTLEAVLQGQAGETAKKGLRSGSAAVGPGATRATRAATS